jgi:hypothetical protein
MVVCSKPSRNCLLSVDFAITTKLALPLPQYSSRGCAGWEARVLVRPACKVAQAHLPMEGVLLASYFGRWASSLNDRLCTSRKWPQDESDDVAARGW